jgi:hypothetical protein
MFYLQIISKSIIIMAKTIKEMAEETYTSLMTLNIPRDYVVGYQDGANYVLDEIECILEDTNLWDCEEICNKLEALVKQLKK